MNSKFKNLATFISIFGISVMTSAQVGIGTESPTESLDIGSGNVRVRDINTTTGETSDNVVVVDADGVLKTINASSMSDTDFYAVGTNTSPSNIADNVWTQGSIMFGNSTGVDGAGSFTSDNSSIVGGLDNNSTGIAAAVFGANHVNTGNGTVIGGSNNTVENNLSAAFGIYNTVSGSGSQSLIFGMGNTITNQQSAAWGIRNTVNSIRSAAWGADNSTNGAGSLVFGRWNTVSSNYAAAWGQYNVDVPNALLTIGNGGSDTNRANALTVLANGNIGTDLATDPTERLDIGSGNVRIRDINSISGAETDKVVVADANGVLKTVNSVASNNTKAIKTGSTIAPDDYTIILNGDINLPDPSANTGRVLVLCGDGAGRNITGSMQDSGGTYSNFGTGTENGGRCITVQSTGTVWWITGRN